MTVWSIEVFIFNRKDAHFTAVEKDDRSAIYRYLESNEKCIKTTFYVKNTKSIDQTDGH